MLNAPPFAFVRLAAYLESEPERKKAQQEAQRAKLEKLEKRLGINGKGKGKEDDDALVGAKRRFDDTEFLEESRDIVDNVKNAVVAGMSLSLPNLRLLLIRTLDFDGFVRSRDVEKEKESEDVTKPGSSGGRGVCISFLFQVLWRLKGTLECRQ